MYRNEAKLWPISAPSLNKNLWMNVFDEWMNKWMNEWMNECSEAWYVIGMKKYVGISRFSHFKRLRDQPTNQQTDRWTWPLKNDWIQENLNCGWVSSKCVFSSCGHVCCLFIVFFVSIRNLLHAYLLLLKD